MNQRLATGAVLVVSGVLLASIQIIHAIQQTSIPVAIVVDGLPFAAMALSISYAGYWLARDTTFEGAAARIAVWGAGATVAFAAVAALMLFSQQVTTGSLERATIITVDLVTVGALAGVLVGLYDAQSRNRLQALEHERDRVESFAQKAADVNNYGRAISSAPSADGVAAFVVEALETLTGIGETAVVRVDDDSAVLLASTVRTVSSDTIGAFAEAARSQPQGEVVVHDESFPVELPSTVTGGLSALILDDEGSATVVVSVTTGESTIAEEDQKLLELIVSHASVRIGTMAKATVEGH